MKAYLLTLALLAGCCNCPTAPTANPPGRTDKHPQRDTVTVIVQDSVTR
jgi:hypothetical protein